MPRVVKVETNPDLMFEAGSSNAVIPAQGVSPERDAP
jgi:hypothetical protein